MNIREQISKVLIVVLMISISLVACYFRSHISGYEKQIRELQVRLAQAKENPDTFFIHDSIPVYRDRVVEVDKTDYKKILADKKLIKELGLKVSQLESENKTLINTKDTVYLNKVNDSTMQYTDKWVNFELFGGRVLSYSVRDSLSVFVSREYKHRFLFWKWGTKGYKVSTVSHNPNCKVEYNKYIKIK